GQGRAEGRVIDPAGEMGQPGPADFELFDERDGFADGEMGPVGLGLKPVEDEQIETADEGFRLIAEDFGVRDVGKEPRFPAGKEKSYRFDLSVGDGQGSDREIADPEGTV